MFVFYLFLVLQQQSQNYRKQTDAHQPIMSGDTNSSAAAAATVATNSITDDLERLLISVVRRHPILYNRSHKFHNRIAHPAAHEETWRIIAAVMRLEESSCKSLWSCIKQKFIKYRKRIATGETVGTKDWPMYDTMYSWLNEHIHTRRSV